MWVKFFNCLFLKIKQWNTLAKEIDGFKGRFYSVSIYISYSGFHGTLPLTAYSLQRAVQRP